MDPLNRFILVDYGKNSSLPGYNLEIKELAAHFDKEKINPHGPYSLHTEYSYGKRNFDTEIVSHYPDLTNSERKGVPQLWSSIRWANAFAEYIIELTRGSIPPTIIEIHPPFDDYCTLNEFIERFGSFSDKLRTVFPNTDIVIENRSGTIYSGGKFLVSKAVEIIGLCERIFDDNLDLRIVLDFPQLLTAEKIDTLNFNREKYRAVIESLHDYQSLVKGVHIWGKKKNASGRWVSHSGNFDTYFGENDESKSCFLAGIHRICDDDTVRYLVPEVNSGTDDLEAIICDLFTS